MSDGQYLRSQLAENFLFLEGKRFSLSNGYDLYKTIYDIPYTTMVLKNGRQTGKTQSLANFMGLDSFAIPYMKSFYISPSQSQTTRYSHTKLQKVISGSPKLKYWFSKGEVNNVFLKTAGNGSECTLSYASDDPDRVRGITSDRNYYDEAQDMDLFEIMVVADACMDASPDPRKHITGTPKTFENPLEEMWQRSNQCEVLIRCRACNLYNLPSEKNIGKHGFICRKCGKTLSVRDFTWKAMKPDNHRVVGFHIPQIVIPAHTENPKKWDLLLEKYETYPTSKFKNEVMAESDSQGSRLLTKEELIHCCQSYRMSRTPHPSILNGIDFTVGGVDWSGGGKDGVSRTVLHIWGVTPDLRFKTLFYQVFPSEDPVSSVDEVVNLCRVFNVRLVIGDQGEGSLANGILREKLGKHRCGKFRYGAFSKPIEVDKDTGVYKLDKTTVIDNYFSFIKAEGVIFPDEADMVVAFGDILAEFSEVTNTGRKIWKHSMSKPDDCLHAQIGGWIAGKLLKRDLTFY